MAWFDNTFSGVFYLYEMENFDGKIYKDAVRLLFFLTASILMFNWLEWESHVKNIYMNELVTHDLRNNNRCESLTTPDKLFQQTIANVLLKCFFAKCVLLKI